MSVSVRRAFHLRKRGMKLGPSSALNETGCLTLFLLQYDHSADPEFSRTSKVNSRNLWHSDDVLVRSRSSDLLLFDTPLSGTTSSWIDSRNIWSVRGWPSGRLVSKYLESVLVDKDRLILVLVRSIRRGFRS